MPDLEDRSNRAEEVRRRRSRKSRSRSASSKSKGRRYTHTSSGPPVLTRSSGEKRASNQPQRRGQRTKRRYDVALSTPGAEMRLPSLPIFHFGWRLVSGLLVGVLLFALYTIWNSPMYQVSTAEVEGLRRLSSLDINAVANVAGKPIFTLDPRQIQRDLQLAFLELESVSVNVKMPAKVIVSVVERQPVLVWEEDGRLMWIDSKGVAFPPRGDEAPSVVVKAQAMPSASPSDLPGDEQIDTTSRYLPSQLVSAILALSVQSPEDTPLVYSVDRGLGWEDPRGWEVYFGMDTDEMEMKLRVYKALVKRLRKENIQPELISVEYVHAPYYRLER